MRMRNWFDARYRQLRKERERAMAFRMQMSDLERQAGAIERTVTKLKAEAMRREQSGDHAGALNAASAAMNQENSLRSVRLAIQKCQSMYDVSQSQGRIDQLLSTCAGLSRKLCGQFHLSDSVRIKEEFERATQTLSATQDMMDALSEGYSAIPEPQARSEAGERALSEIMDEYGAQAAPETTLAAPQTVTEQATQASSDTETAPSEDDALHNQWRQSRRELLPELMG